MRDLEGRLLTLERHHAGNRVVRTFLEQLEQPPYFREITPGVVSDRLYTEQEISVLAADVIIKAVYI